MGRVLTLSRIAVIVGVVGGVVAMAQSPVSQERATGEAIAAWTKWQAVLDALGSRNAANAETVVGEFLKDNPSPLRVALLVEHTELKTKQGGVLLTLEHDVAGGTAGDNAKALWALIDTGREQMNQADDGWYFAAIGQFGIANANFAALLASNPDPVALLEFADRVHRRHQILSTLATDPIIGESARGILKLLGQGEMRIKADPTRIHEQITRLGGAPRAFENAVAALRDSGEYAVPFLFQTLRDPSKKALTQAIARTIPKIDRPALNPLVMALRTKDQAALLTVIRSLGQIPYYQSVPYLMALRDDASATADARQAVDAALSDLASRGVSIRPGLSTAEAFYDLAKAYYYDERTVAPDYRLDRANVWYYRDDLIQNVEVPTMIFNEVMCMRCCEEALRHSPDLKPAMALWLAANARREAQLPPGTPDHTRPDNYPAALYFAQTAGAEHNLIALSRAVDDGDPVVALSSIDALRRIAGTSSVLSGVSERQPLAEALSFPDRLVRVRAGLALANALPGESFHNYQNLMPVLNEALNLHAGASNALVIDAEDLSANYFAAHLRALGYSASIDANLLSGLRRARSELPGVDVIVVASDVSAPDLAGGLKQLRDEVAFRFTPVVIIAKKGDIERVSEAAASDHRLAWVAANVDAEGLKAAVQRVSRSVGATTITAELGASLALEAAQALGQLALTNNPVFRVEDAEKGLVGLLSSKDVQLRQTAAAVLGFIGHASAQSAIAEAALSAAEAPPMRVVMFAALAEAAKRRGNLLPDPMVAKLIESAQTEADLTVRTAAAQALGALNLATNPASTIVRNQYGG